MAKKTTSKEIHQPDDAIFKTLMKKPENAAGYLQTFAPEWAEKINLKTLEWQAEGFQIPNMKTFDADIVYRCQLKETQKQIFLSFLWENKSKPETYISIQVGLYLYLAYNNMIKSKHRRLEPIIPLYFYNGKENWTPKSILDLFAHHPLFDFVSPFLPNFKFHYTNIYKVPEELLKVIFPSVFRSGMVAMANKHDFDLLIEKFPIIFDVETTELDDLMAVAYYIFGIFERLPEEIQERIGKFDTKIKVNVMSTLGIILERGRKEGIEIGIDEGRREGRREGHKEGRKEGHREGRKEGIEKGKIEMVQEMYKEGASISFIAKCLKKSEAYVKTLLNIDDAPANIH